MILGLAAALGAVLVHPEGEAGYGLGDDSNAGVDCGELDRCLRGDGLARATGAEVEGWGCADGVLGLVAGAEETGEGIFHYLPPMERIGIMNQMNHEEKTNV